MGNWKKNKDVNYKNKIASFGVLYELYDGKHSWWFYITLVCGLCFFMQCLNETFVFCSCMKHQGKHFIV